ncbi:MAG: rRNA maturation RNase YbeY [Candidatus Ratteibacteria bacterium]
MKKEVEIKIFYRQRKIKLNKELLNEKIERLKEIIEVPLKQISVYLVNNKIIKNLNKKFLNKNNFTDVLTFKLSRNFGEIIISVEECKKNAKVYGNTLENEILYVLIHGILHLMNYKDYTEKEREKMFKIQNEIFKNLINDEAQKKFKFA